MTDLVLRCLIMEPEVFSFNLSATELNSNKSHESSGS